MRGEVTSDQRPLGGVDGVREALRDLAYLPGTEDPRMVGLEAELFPLWRTPDGRPAARLALVEVIALVSEIAGIVRDDAPDGRPAWRLASDLITVEPGAQVEIAGPPLADANHALDALERALGALRGVFEEAGAVLAGVGLDCWTRPEEIPIQLGLPRYQAMSAYFAARHATSGHMLMATSASLQVNLDLGPAGLARRRWLAANLLAPVWTAAFTTSPTTTAANARARGWRHLDPTRTGVAPPLLAGEDDPLEHVLSDALRADVMFVERRGVDQPGRPGWTFEDWVRDGHRRYGPARVADLSHHLTTLFPEVRLRRFIEVRGIDQLPPRWMQVPVVLATGLLYDDEALSTSLELLRGWRSDLPEMLSRAAERGLADETIATAAAAVLDAGLAGATRLGTAAGRLARTDAFLEAFTRRRRAPADELSGLLARPAEALRWATT